MTKFPPNLCATGCQGYTNLHANVVNIHDSPPYLKQDFSKIFGLFSSRTKSVGLTTYAECKEILNRTLSSGFKRQETQTTIQMEISVSIYRPQVVRRLCTFTSDLVFPGFLGWRFGCQKANISMRNNEVLPMFKETPHHVLLQLANCNRPNLFLYHKIFKKTCHHSQKNIFFNSLVKFAWR
jgi:hypothetical protein